MSEPSHGRTGVIVAALSAALVAALVAALMVAVGAANGSAFVVSAELLGFAFIEGPGWLGVAVAVGLVLVASLMGAWLAPRAMDAPLFAAVVGVLGVVSAYVLWVFGWTAVRLAALGGMLAAPFLPFHAALLAFAGLLLPATVLFMPAAMLWAWGVRAILTGASATAS